MALYHLHVDQIKRSDGRSAVACAAYRAGERLYDDYYGEQKDYTRKGGVVLSEIHLPPHAPEKYQDRETLWNELERAEKHKRAQLAHSFDIALMNEFTMDENIELVRRFVKEQFVSRGMIVDLAIHKPEKNGGNPNPHVHMMIPIRPINADGTWGIKEKKMPLLDEQGNPVKDKNGRTKMMAVSTTGWSSAETLKSIRKAWADYNNALFEKKGMDTRIDWRSYEEQGISRIPTIHEGAAVRKMEARGIETELGKLNRMIRSVNAFLTQVGNMISWLKNKVNALSEALRQMPEPTLAGYLQTYYQERDRVAETYRYGTQKAQISNLQDHARVVNYLLTEKITTPSQLHERLENLDTRLKSLADEIKRRKDEIKTVSRHVQKAEQYFENKAVVKEYEKKIFKKKFYKAHEKEIRSYYAAEKYLAALRTEDGKLPVERWKRQQKSLNADVTRLAGEQMQLEPDMKMLRKVQRALDEALRLEQSDENTAIRCDGEPKKSIHEKLARSKEKADRQKMKKTVSIDRESL